MPQHLIIYGLSTTEQATKEAKELIKLLKNPGPKTPFTIIESQFHAIKRLATLFNNIQPQQPKKPNTKVFPREVPSIAPLTVPITVPSPRVSMTVASPREMAPRIPLISEDYNVEDTNHVEAVEHNKCQQQLHWYPNIIS